MPDKAICRKCWEAEGRDPSVLADETMFWCPGIARTREIPFEAIVHDYPAPSNCPFRLEQVQATQVIECWEQVWPLHRTGKTHCMVGG